jgi:hypothetical protein
MFATHEKFVDPSTKEKLLSKGALKQFDNLLRHVDRDCLSDLPDVQLYFKTRLDQNGLQLYRIARGTSDVEGAVH